MVETILVGFIVWFAGKWIISEREARYYKKLVQRKIK